MISKWGFFWFVQYDVIFLMKLLKNSVVNLVISMPGFPDFLSPWLSARAPVCLNISGFSADE